MEFRLDVPIYMQIATDIKEQIINGTISEGDKLHSVREYSIEYEVSPLTIQRTIQLLDNEQMIYSKKGVGSFVKEGARLRLQKSLVEVTIQEFVFKLKNCGLSDKEILEMVRKNMNREGEKR